MFTDVSKSLYENGRHPRQISTVLRENHAQQVNDAVNADRGSLTQSVHVVKTVFRRTVQGSSQFGKDLGRVLAETWRRAA